MSFCVLVHGIFFSLKLIIYMTMSGVVGSLSWGVVTTRICTVDLSKSANRRVPLASLVQSLTVHITYSAALTPMHLPPYALILPGLGPTPINQAEPAFHFWKLIR